MSTRSVASKFFSVVGILTTLAVGVFGAVHAVRYLQIAPSTHVDKPASLVEDRRALEFTPSTPIPPTTVVADRITLDGGRLIFPDGALLLANHIELRPSTVIEGANIRMVAADISGGRIDAMGRGAGAKGGKVFIGAVNLSHIEIDAGGADGAFGPSGRDGQDGRSGSCNGFGGYRGADAGMQGSDGGVGQAGGDGGIIVLRVNEKSDVQLRNDGGSGGPGGSGGRGGHGGRGCVGLGGAQPSQGDGAPGRQGPAGSAGKRYEPDIRKITFQELHSAVSKYSGDPTKIEDFLAH